MDVFDFIISEFKPIYLNSEEFFYNDMESQSGYSLPIIYKPFDPENIFHWADRGALFDFMYSISNVEEKKLLDFGPGDGWPSLIIAPYAKEIVGVDASQKRIEVCRKNSEKLGFKNTNFITYKNGEKLPFGNDIFDGIIASSSIEQTPNPKETLKELYRVLKPGGKLRFGYEALNRYKNGQENDIWISVINDSKIKIFLYDRRIEEEYALQYSLTLKINKEAFFSYFEKCKEITFNMFSVELIQRLKPFILKVFVCKLYHPSGKTFINWLKEIGFQSVFPSHKGNYFAAKLFESYSKNITLKTMEEVDELIKLPIKTVINLEAPMEIDPWITAIK